MDRVHYRRITPPRLAPPPSGWGSAIERGPAARQEGGGLPEKLLMQGIASVIILVALMGLCLLEYDITQSARNGIRQALEGETTFSGLWTQLQKQGDIWLGSAPGSEEPRTITETQPTAVPLPVLPVTVEPNAPALAPAAQDGYIDMDVLAELNALAAEGDESKSPVPEPPAFPEP